MSETAWTRGPWEYIPGTEHHGPYVSGPFGGDICDCYAMSNPESLSVRNGGKSQPIWHQAERADANARLISASPEMHEANKSSLMVLCAIRGAHLWSRNMLADIDFAIEANRAALAKVKGAPLSSEDEGTPHVRGQQNEGAES